MGLLVWSAGQEVALAIRHGAGSLSRRGAIPWGAMTEDPTRPGPEEISRIDLAEAWAVHCQFAGDKIIRGQTFLSWEEALRAVGLET